MQLGIWIALAVTLTAFLAGLFFLRSRERPSKASLPETIRLEDLESLIRQILQNQSPDAFAGITSNGIDTLYFVPKGRNIYIEYEAMTEAQKPYLDKLKRFAKSQGLPYKQTTYGNKPEYDAKEAPVLQITVNGAPAHAAGTARRIMEEVFGRTPGTVFEVVP